MNTAVVTFHTISSFCKKHLSPLNNTQMISTILVGSTSLSDQRFCSSKYCLILRLQYSEFFARWKNCCFFFQQAKKKHWVVESGNEAKWVYACTLFAFGFASTSYTKTILLHNLLLTSLYLCVSVAQWYTCT